VNSSDYLSTYQSQDQPYDASAPVVEDIISVLLSLLTLCHTHEEEEGEAERGKKIKEKEEMLRQIVNLVVQDLENGKPAVRVGVKVRLLKKEWEAR